LLDLVERSITGERVVDELEKVLATVGDRPRCCGWTTGPELVSQTLQQFCDGKTGMSHIPPGCPWVNGHSLRSRLLNDSMCRCTVCGFDRDVL
jgi:putative transposase